MDPAEIESHVRPSPIAGTWYPGDPAALRETVTALLGRAAPWDGECVRGLIAPHAGLVYSGETAAEAYATLGDTPVERVVVLAPNHRVAWFGAAVDPSTAYETPLGRMRVDTEAVGRLARSPQVVADRRPFALEHAIEMHLPFLQVLRPEARLVPVIVGETRDADTDRAVAEALAPLRDDTTLWVVSSDFMHYGAAFGYVPFATDVRERIHETDRQAIDAILSGDPETFRSVQRRTGNTICGRNPIAVFLHLAPRTWRRTLRAYTTSGDLTGNFAHSVSYASLVFDEPAGAERTADAEEADTVTGGAAVTEGIARELLGLARQTLENLQDPPVLADPPEPLRRAAGVFVSLHRKRDHRLRGCIGMLEPRLPLWQAVVRATRAAALQDPRFEPVRPEEVGDLEIEVSVLGALEPVRDVSEIVVGRHGVVVERGMRRGLLLPQVPVRFGWDRETFLENACRKADLPADAWRDPATRLYRFEARVFDEGTPSGPVASA